MNGCRCDLIAPFHRECFVMPYLINVTVNRDFLFLKYVYICFPRMRMIYQIHVNQQTHVSRRIYLSARWVIVGSCNGLSFVWSQRITRTDFESFSIDILWKECENIDCKMTTLLFTKFDKIHYFSFLHIGILFVECTVTIAQIEGWFAHNFVLSMSAPCDVISYPNVNVRGEWTMSVK